MEIHWLLGRCDSVFSRLLRARNAPGGNREFLRAVYWIPLTSFVLTYSHPIEVLFCILSLVDKPVRQHQLFGTLGAIGATRARFPTSTTHEIVFYFIFFLIFFLSISTSARYNLNFNLTPFLSRCFLRSGSRIISDFTIASSSPSCGSPRVCTHLHT